MEIYSILIFPKPRVFHRFTEDRFLLNPLLLKTRLKMLKTPCPTRLSDFHNYNIPFFLCKRQLPIFPKSIINEKTDVLPTSPSLVTFSNSPARFCGRLVKHKSFTFLSPQKFNIHFSRLEHACIKGFIKLKNTVLFAGFVIY